MRTRGKRQKGAALVEFALLALALYLLVAGGIELGRAVFVSQTIQDAARVAARELSLIPLSAIETFDCPATAQAAGECTPATSAVNDTKVLGQVWNPNLLVIDIKNCYQLPGGGLDSAALSTYINSLPAVNRALEPLFINEIVNVGGTEEHFLRYPGALLSDTTATAGLNTCPVTYDPTMPFNPTKFTVGVPWVRQRDNNGVETISWVPVLEEIRPCSDHPTTGPFSYAGSQIGNGTDPASQCTPPFHASGNAVGLASVRINYPFQSPALSGFRDTPAGVDANGEPNPNLAFAIPADDAGVTVDGSAPANTASVDSECADVNGVVTPCLTYSGRYGLGKQYAFAGRVSADGSVSPTNAVRPYRNLLSGQATFRREVTQ